MDKSDLGQDKAIVKKAFKQHDAQKHKGSKGTTLKLKAGGPTSDCKPMKFGEKTAEKISHDKARGAGAAVKGVNFRTTL